MRTTGKHKASRIPTVPRHLRSDGKALWKTINMAYVLSEDALILLCLACESMDRAADARRFLDAEGTTTPDRFGQPKMRAEVLIERDSRAAVVKTLAKLGLDLEPLNAGRGRPPGR